MTDDTPKPIPQRPPALFGCRPWSRVEAEESPNAEFMAWLAREHPEIKLTPDTRLNAGMRLAAEAFRAGRGLL